MILSRTLTAILARLTCVANAHQASVQWIMALIAIGAVGLAVIGVITLL